MVTAAVPVGEHERIVERAKEEVVGQDGLPVLDRPGVGDIEEAEELHEGAEQREEHRRAEHHQHQRQHEGEGGRAQAAELVRLVLELPGHRGVAPPARQPLLHEDEGQHSGEDEDGERGGRVVARHARHEQVVDHRAEHEEAEGQAEHLLDLEGLQRHHRAEQQHRQDHRGHHRHGDAERRAERARSRDAGGLLERGVHLGEGRREEDHFHRQGAGDDVDPDDAPERVDIERPLADEGQRRERGIDQAVLGIEEEDPAQGHREARQEEGRPERELDPAPAGQVRPREQPRDEHGERQGQDLPDEGDGERVPERAAQSRLAEGGAPAVEPVARRLARRRHLKALYDDEEEGEDHAERDEREDDGAEHRLRLDAARARQCGGLAQAGHTLTSSAGKAS